MARQNPFDCSDFLAQDAKLSYLDSGGGGAPLHFFHANGFPVSMYLPFMTELAEDFRVLGLSLRGQDGLSEGIESWHRLSFDLIGFLDAIKAGPVVGVGHSIGAVATLLAAARRPDLFSRVIFLDPVLMPRRYIILTRLLKIVGRKNRFPLAQRARRRRNGWTDRAEALEYFREKSLFRNWEEPYLKAYVTFGLMPDATGRVVLVCPPEAEARGFENYPTDIWSWPRRLTVPTLIVRGGDSDALPPECYEKLCRICPRARGTAMQGVGHFIPMEKPSETLRIIRDFCSP
jgi:pimeloyl-ACP methyl ester carboxylesterase